MRVRVSVRVSVRVRVRRIHASQGLKVEHRIRSRVWVGSAWFNYLQGIRVESRG